LSDPEALAARAIEAYLAGRAARLLHASRKRAVALVEPPAVDAPVVIKHYRPLSLRGRAKTIFRAPPHRRSHEAARRLAALGVGTPRPLALVERERGEAFLVTEAATDALPLDRFFLRRFTREAPLAFRRGFLAALADEIVRLHERSVYQADLKTCNILVREAEPSADAGAGAFAFLHVDLDDVRFDRPLSLRERLLNLAQLHSSTPRAVTFAERLRFFHRVLGRDRLDARAKRDLLRLLAVSARRGLVFFGFEGPLEQGWTPGDWATRPGTPRD